MKSNRLWLNPTKTEFLWFATPRLLYYFNDSPFILGNIVVKPTTIARNLGVMMNQDFSMMFHINKLVLSCFYSQQIRSIRWSLTFDAARKLICNLIYSHATTGTSSLEHRHNLSTVCNRFSLILPVRYAICMSTIIHITPAIWRLGGFWQVTELLWHASRQQICVLIKRREADKRIILHCLQASRTSEPTTPIIVWTPDTDLLVLFVSYASTVTQPLYLDTGSGNKRRMVDINAIADVAGPDLRK